MKYAKAILLSIAVAAVSDILIDVLIPDHVMNVVFVVTMSILLFGILLAAFGTVTKNGWGVNLHPVNCPACGSLMPTARRPESRSRPSGAATLCPSPSVVLRGSSASRLPSQASPPCLRVYAIRAESDNRSQRKER